MSSIRAGISGYSQSDYFCNNHTPATLASVRDELFILFSIESEYLGNLTIQMDRSAKMMLYALIDLHNQKELTKKVPLIWLKDGLYPGCEAMPMDFIKEQLANFDAPIDLNNIHTLSLGRAGGIGAIDRAQQLLAHEDHNFVLIGGAECPYQRDWLYYLDNNDRLKSEYSEDAFVPGEAAAFLLLARTPDLAHQQKGEAIQIYTPGVLRAPAHWHNEEPDKAETLHAAMSHAIQNFSQAVEHKNDKISLLVSSMNGENYWAKEYGVATTRLNNAFTKQFTHEHPFEFTGDLGCIASVFLLGYTVEQLFIEQHKNALVYASSDNAWRSAVCLSKFSCKQA